MRSVENAVWKIRIVENDECGKWVEISIFHSHAGKQCTCGRQLEC